MRIAKNKNIYILLAVSGFEKLPKKHSNIIVDFGVNYLVLSGTEHQVAICAGKYIDKKIERSYFKTRADCEFEKDSIRDYFYRNGFYLSDDFELFNGYVSADKIYKKYGQSDLRIGGELVRVKTIFKNIERIKKEIFTREVKNVSINMQGDVNINV